MCASFLPPFSCPYEIDLPLATWESTFFWFSRGATLVFFGMPFQIVRVGAKLCCLLRCSEPVPYHNQYWTVSATTYKIHPCFPIHVSSPGAGIQFLSSVEQGIVSIYFLYGALSASTFCSLDPLGGVTLGCPPSKLFSCVWGGSERVQLVWIIITNILSKTPLNKYTNIHFPLFM